MAGSEPAQGPLGRRAAAKPTAFKPNGLRRAKRGPPVRPGRTKPQGDSGAPPPLIAKLRSHLTFYALFVIVREVPR